MRDSFYNGRYGSGVCKMEKILILFAVLLLAPFCMAEPSKSELDALRDKAKAKEEEIKKYQEQEKQISRQLSALEQKQAAADKVINKIEFDISLVEQNKITAANKKEALERSQPVWEYALEKEAAEFLANKLADRRYYDSNSQLRDILLNRALEHKSLFAAGLKKENRLAGISFSRTATVKPTEYLTATGLWRNCSQLQRKRCLSVAWNYFFRENRNLHTSD